MGQNLKVGMLIEGGNVIKKAVEVDKIEWLKEIIAAGKQKYGVNLTVNGICAYAQPLLTLASVNFGIKHFLDTYDECVYPLGESDNFVNLLEGARIVVLDSRSANYEIVKLRAISHILGFHNLTLANSLVLANPSEHSVEQVMKSVEEKIAMQGCEC